MNATLPEGITEASPQQARRLEAYRRCVLDCFQTHGYQLVAPPLVEYRDALVANDSLAQQTLLMTDPMSGATLGLRADMTPQVARMDARYMRQEQTARLCYAGSVMRARPEILGGSRNLIQAGAELYGCDSANADAEIVQLLCAALQACNCSDVCLDVGHAGVFRALAAQAQWTDAQRDEVFDILQRKAMADLEAWLEKTPTPQEVVAALRALPEELSGPSEAIVLARAEELLSCISESLADALDRLRTVAKRVRQLYPGVRFHFDLGEANGFHYESGIVFAIYREGRGQEIARGGRYGGRERRPATGFSLDLHQLMECSTLEAAPLRRVYAPVSDDLAQQQAIAELRAQGCVVIGALEVADTPQASDCTEQLVRDGDTWVVRPVDA